MENSENSKTAGSTFMINVLMFFVLLFITFIPPAFIMWDYVKALFTLDIAAAIKILEDLTFFWPLVMILLNGAFAYVCLTMEKFKTNTTKAWAYIALADCVWWIYAMI